MIKWLIIGLIAVVLIQTAGDFGYVNFELPDWIPSLAPVIQNYITVNVPAQSNMTTGDTDTTPDVRLCDLDITLRSYLNPLPAIANCFALGGTPTVNHLEVSCRGAPFLAAVCVSPSALAAQQVCEINCGAVWTCDNTIPYVGCKY